MIFLSRGPHMLAAKEPFSFLLETFPATAEMSVYSVNTKWPHSLSIFPKEPKPVDEIKLRRDHALSLHHRDCLGASAVAGELAGGGNKVKVKQETLGGRWKGELFQ